VVPGPLDESVRRRILEETHGNPLAILEFGRQLGTRGLAGGFALPDAVDLPGRIENLYAERLGQLPPEVQRLLLLAAAEPAGDAALVLRAAQTMGVTPGAVTLATSSGLLELGAHVRFRHPLVRSAVYRAAKPEDRRATHAALAIATDPLTDPDRRAWHRSHAATGPDEEVARELVACADRAQRRGGVAASAAFWERAVALTPDPDARASRALVAAEAKYAAGDFEATQALLVAAEVGPADELRQAHVERMRAQMEFALHRGSDAPPLLLHAARRLEPLDPALAREVYLDALVAAIYAGRLAHDGDASNVARAAALAPFGPEPLEYSQALLRGVAMRITDGYATSAPILKGALQDYRTQQQEQDPGWIWAALNLVAMDLWDDEAWFELATDQVRRARASGTLSWLPFALDYLAEHHVLSGEFEEAASLLVEAERIDPGVRASTLPYVPLLLAAWRGDALTVAALAREMVHGASSRGEGAALTYAEYAQAVMHNGLGNYGLAAEAAHRASAVDELVISPRALFELVEAGSRSGQVDHATEALERLSERTRASGTEWALGVEACARAMLSEKALAERCYRDAIERLGRTRVRTGLARAHLVYGEWLRRENRRVDARKQLRTAHEMLSTMGLEAFADRARRELLATGETVRKRSVETRDELTPQEAEIARLAADGLTNPEIGAQLFISARTVEWHLRKIFTKLGVTSRRSLRGTLPDSARTAPKVRLPI
jgi:DNA-binding CsgD family transcriptional regulator